MDFSGIRTETEFFSFQGGMDTSTPALRVAPGAVLAGFNYEPDQNGGYTRMKGYERFDGRTSPSSATSSSSGTPAEVAQSLVDAADVLRAFIAAPTGSGPVRGVCYYAGALYAFRDNAGGTAGQMFKSSASGWAAVALGEEIAFTNANTNVQDGDTLTQGGVTATVRRVVVATGTLQSGTNTGRLILTGRTGGNFVAGAATSTGSGALTLGGAQTAITFPPGGRYEFDLYNFAGGTSTLRMYGANGVGRSFEFDGTTLVPISTGAAVDAPKFIKANRKYLYLAQGASLTNSSVGEPQRYVAGEGAVENPLGDTITGIAALPGQALGIMCRNSSHALTGSSIQDWVTNSIRDDVGAVPYTVSNMSETYMLDDRGVTSIRAVQEYGNFADATLSRRVQKLIDKIRGKVVGSYVSRQKGLYVLLMNDGATLTMGVSNGQVSGFIEGQLGFSPSCVWSGEDETGIERTFIGATNGMVHEMNKGSTFDGAPIESLIKLHYYNSKSPRIKKRYRKLVLEMTSELYSELRFLGELSYGDVSIHQVVEPKITVGGNGGSWDLSNWDEFFWDSQDVNQPEFSLDGVGLNMAFSFYSNTKLDFGHTLQGAIVHYSMRRQQR